MSARSRQDEPIPETLPSRPRVSLWAWYQAWREIVRSPDKTIPEPDLPPEGDPIPAELGLRCPECGHSISGLREWICPECGEHFSPRRAYTLRMLQEPEYFLRYRFSPRDIRTIMLTVLMLVLGTILAIVAGAQYLVSLSVVSTISAPITLGVKTLIAVDAAAVPFLIIFKFLTEVPWFRVAFFYSLIWFLTAVVIVLVRVL
jgi:DNA-directed RNA polymerase subunit RPC12/RpoP